MMKNKCINAVLKGSILTMYYLDKNPSNAGFFSP